MNKALFTYILIIGIAGTAGTTTGVLGKNLLGQEEVIYKGDPNQYQDDAAALLTEYEKNPKKNFTASQLVNIGLEKYRRCENSYSIGIGLADTVVKQTIRNYQIKNGDTYFEESISKSDMVGVANRAVQTGKNGNIRLYKGNAGGAEKATYPAENPSKDKQWSKEEYKNYLGRTLDQMFIYIIGNDTVLSEGTKIEKSGDEIKVTLNLHPDIASYYYKIQMKNISGLDALPSFAYLKHTYTFSKDMVLKEMCADEKYTASMGISVNIRNTINYYYHANEVMEIPSNNTSLDYSKI